MAKLVKLQYVGNKKTAYDNIARSGVTWNGRGDVQEVTDVQAKLLLKFPDQWALMDEKDRKAVEKPETLKVVDEDGDAVIVSPDDLKKPLEVMSKAELRAYAMHKWGKDLPIEKDFSCKRMIDQIEEWDQELDVKIGVN